MKKKMNINNKYMEVEDERYTLTSQKTHPLIPIFAKNFETEDLIEVKTASWDQPYFDLFDYENHDYDMKRFQFQKSKYFYKNQEDNEISMCDSDSEQKEKKSIFVVEKRDKDFYLTFEKEQNNNFDSSKYIVVKSLVHPKIEKEIGYVLKAGDIIRLGQIEFKITEMKSLNEETNELELEKDENLFFDESKLIKDKIFVVTEEVEKYNKRLKNKQKNPLDLEESDKEKSKEEEQVCRICFLDEICDDPMDNLFIDPCNCKGGSKYVHVICLRRWIQKKIEAKNTSSIITYKLDNVKCEICKNKWPVVVKHKNISRRLFDVKKPDSAFMFVEKISDKSQESSNAMTMILENQGRLLNIGKAMNSGLRLSDPSISDQHCSIQYIDGKFILKDCNSKFGTLVKLNNEWKIAVSYTHLRAHETSLHLVCRLLLEKKKK